MTRVKICGLNDPEGFDAAVQAGADWVGFNFFPASPRYVTPAQAAALAARAPHGPTRVGLFVAPTIADIQAVLDVLSLDALQLYTDPATALALGAHFALPIWRPVGVTTGAAGAFFCCAHAGPASSTANTTSHLPRISGEPDYQASPEPLYQA